jgi:hypothetical protein
MGCSICGNSRDKLNKNEFTIGDGNGMVIYPNLNMSKSKSNNDMEKDIFTDKLFSTLSETYGSKTFIQDKIKQLLRKNSAVRLQKSFRKLFKVKKLISTDNPNGIKINSPVNSKISNSYNNSQSFIKSSAPHNYSPSPIPEVKGI